MKMKRVLKIVMDQQYKSCDSSHSQSKYKFLDVYGFCTDFLTNYGTLLKSNVKNRTMSFDLFDFP